LEAALTNPSDLKDAYKEGVAAGVDQELLQEAAWQIEAEELRSKIKEFAASFQLVSLERSLKLWAEKGYHGDMAEIEAQLPEIRRQLSQCQDDLDAVMKRIDFTNDGKKLEDSGLEVLDEVASVLEKNPRVPILVDVCSSASQSEEEKLLQAAVVKQELSSRCSNEIKVSGAKAAIPFNVRIRVESKAEVREVLTPKVPKAPKSPKRRKEVKEVTS